MLVFVSTRVCVCVCVISVSKNTSSIPTDSREPSSVGALPLESHLSIRPSVRPSVQSFGYQAVVYQ